MQEVGISEQQFLDACSSPFAKSKTLQVSENALKFHKYTYMSKERECVCVCDKVLIRGDALG